MTFETSYQSDEETLPDQQKDNDKEKHNDKGKDKYNDKHNDKGKDIKRTPSKSNSETCDLHVPNPSDK